jgi:hypothetical protein
MCNSYVPYSYYKIPYRQLTLILLGSKISLPRAFHSFSNISMSPFIYPKGKTIIKIHLLVTSTMLVLLVRLVIRGCAATITSTTNAEDLSQFSKEGPELCPGQIGWPQVPAPISCDDPACRGMSWAVPPFRCRQHDGVMFGKELLGCPCCPRLVDCDNQSVPATPTTRFVSRNFLPSVFVSYPGEERRLLPQEHHSTVLLLPRKWNMRWQILRWMKHRTTTVE